MSKNNFDFEIQMRYPDFDTQLFVNHSRICSYIESAYISFFIDHIKSGWNFGLLPILLKQETTQFFNPIRHNSNPVCRLSVLEVREKGVKIKVEINDKSNKDLIYASGERILVHVEINSATPQKFPQYIFNELEKFKQP